MGYFQQRKNFICFLLLISIGLFLFRKLEARPLFPVEFAGIRNGNLFWREFAAMLPKGVPVPPSGPSPEVN